MGLYTPTILGGNSYLSWFYDRGAITDTAHTGTSKGLSQAINRGPIRKFLPKYANVYVIRVAKFACPRVLDDQKMSEDNQKMRCGCPPDYQIFGWLK